jgi:uncharacterized protein YndB with AHSA1/START domain
VDLTASLEAPVAAERLFAWVDDLDRYPAWLDIVPTARRAAEADGDPGPAWVVDLRGRLGPFARSKRLRMVRSRHDPPSAVTFERRETDGRSHSPWVLRAEVAGDGTGSRLTVHLHYGGGLWGPVLERLLTDAVERSRARLLALATQG